MRARESRAPAAALVAVPTLDDLAREPDQAATLPLDAVRGLFVRVSLVHSVLLGRLVEGPNTASPPLTPPIEPLPEWLSAAQVHARFGLSSAWLAEHRRELRRAGIASQASRKYYVYSVRKLGRYLEARCEQRAGLQC